MDQIDERQFADLYSAAHPRLWTLASAILGDRTMAEDVVQDAALFAIGRLGDFEKGTDFLAWMSQIVRFKALNQLKSARIRKTRSLQIHKGEDRSLDIADNRDGGDVDRVVSQDGFLLPEQQEFDDRVATALATLDPDRRACLLLRTVHNMSYEEIGQVVGVAEGTASSHVHRAKTAIRRYMMQATDERTGNYRTGRDEATH